MRPAFPRICMRLAVAWLGLLVAACDARFTADLGSSPPADPAISNVRANLRGLEFREADGGTATLEFSSGEVIDLLGLRTGDPLRLFTDEQLSAGHYTGVRLLFDTNEDPNRVTTAVGGQFPLVLAEGAYAAVDFQVQEEERSDEALTLILDLRQSLSFDETDADYTLTPRLRAVRTDEAAAIEGAVTAACPAGTSLASGGAVYLYTGRDVQPDDLDGAGAEPFATTTVEPSPVTGFSYALRFLPPGPYTLALTCNGDEDVVAVDDEVAFGVSENVELDEGELRRVDID